MIGPYDILKNNVSDWKQYYFFNLYDYSVKDAPAFDNQSGKRRLKAFVGGLDLQDGRWDTPEHPLFETILNEHLGDFRNKSAKTVPPEQGMYYQEMMVNLIVYSYSIIQPSFMKTKPNNSCSSVKDKSRNLFGCLF